MINILKLFNKFPDLSHLISYKEITNIATFCRIILVMSMSCINQRFLQKHQQIKISYENTLNTGNTLKMG